MIRTKRAYEEPSPEDGQRILVDRLWPRGISKEDVEIDRWMKEVAPRAELRKWFDHDPERWEGFKERYREQLREQEAMLEPLREMAREGTVTLVYAARDTEHNNAVALKEHLERKGEGE